MTSPDFWLAPREVLTEEQLRPLREFEERKRLADAAAREQERAAEEERRARAAETRARLAEVLDRLERDPLASKKERALVEIIRAWLPREAR